MTSRPSASGPRGRRILIDRRLPRRERDLRRLGVAVDVPLAHRRRVAGHPERAAHRHPAAEQPRQGRLQLQRPGQRGQRPQRHERDLARPAARLVDDELGCGSCGQGDGRLRQLRVADPVRAVRLGRDLERPSQRCLAADGDLDVGPAGQLQHRPRVPRDVGQRRVARQARHRDELRLRARGGVQQRQRVVDPRVDVEDQRDAVHGQASEAMTARSREAQRQRTRRGDRVVELAQHVDRHVGGSDAGEPARIEVARAGSRGSRDSPVRYDDAWVGHQQ